MRHIFFKLIFILLSLPSLTFADAISVITRTGVPQLFTVPETKVHIPTNGTNAPSFIMSKGNNTIFFATGVAAQILAGANSKREVPLETNKYSLNFRNILFIQDNDNRRIGAAYPLLPYRDVYITALHLLKDSHFENTNLIDLKYIGFRNDKTNQLYDVALVVNNTNNESLNQFLQNLNNLNSESSDIYLNHLNLIDNSSEMTLTQSVDKIVAANEDYIFFRNSQDSFVGPSSSGAILYDTTNNTPIASVVCSSLVQNNEKSHLIRNLKFTSLKNENSILLTPELINSFKPLDCRSYDGRKGGGD